MWAERGLRWVSEASLDAQDQAKMRPTRAKESQYGTTMRQDRANWGVKMGRCGAKMEPTWAKIGLRWANLHFPKKGVSPRRERHFGTKTGSR